jgi:hypothetical protein
LRSTNNFCAQRFAFIIQLRVVQRKNVISIVSTYYYIREFEKAQCYFFELRLILFYCVSRKHDVIFSPTRVIIKKKSKKVYRKISVMGLKYFMVAHTGVYERETELHNTIVMIYIYGSDRDVGLQCNM